MGMTWRREEGAAVWSWCQCFCCNLRCYRAAARSTLPVYPLALRCGHETCDLDAGQWKIGCSLPYHACLKKQFHDFGCAAFCMVVSMYHITGASCVFSIYHIIWTSVWEVSSVCVCILQHVWIEGLSYISHINTLTHSLPYAYWQNHSCRDKRKH